MSLATRVGQPFLEALEPRLLLDGSPEEQALELFSASPALFVENQGQWDDPAVRYVHNGSGANVIMTDSGPVFQVFRQVPCERAEETPGDDLSAPLLSDPLRSDHFDPEQYETEMLQFSASFSGANTVAPVGLDRSEATFNYFVGDDEALWREGVASYEIVAYEGLYEGVDLYTWGRRSHLKYEFRVAPGADWSAIRVRYEGIKGLSLAGDGSLVADLGEGWGSLTDDAPYIYQVVDGEQVAVAGRFTLVDGSTYAFEVTGTYDPARTLVIDPDLAWAIYVVGSDPDYGKGIAVDASGNALVTGYTHSSGWVSGGWDTSHNGGRDAFVMKLSPSGGHVWSTYLGGSDYDYGFDIAVDSSGNALVTGWTYSSGWVSGGWDTSYSGGSDAFVVKLSPSGGHLWSTYLGGTGVDAGSGIAVDSSGNVLAAGETHSSDWVSGGWDTSRNGYSDAFVVKLSPSGGHVWSTYLGGGSFAWGSDIAVDSSGNALVTGETDSSGWVSGGWDTSYNGGSADAFVVKLSPSGGHVWSTYLGGSSYDWGSGIAVDSSGSALVTGETRSSGWVSGGWDTSHNGGYDAFVVKLSPSGGHLWSTYLGGSGEDTGAGIAVDSCGSALVTGETRSSGWVSGGWDTSFNGDRDAFVVKFSPSGGHLWSTYLGGSSVDAGYGVAVDSCGSALVTGVTYFSFEDAFVAKIVEPQDWTVMVFSNGDNNLEATALGNLDQMENVDLSTSKVRCVIEIDRSATDTGRGFSGALVPSAGIASSNWSDTRRGFVCFDERTGFWSTSLLPADPTNPEQDMGDDQALVEFVQWAMAAAPARHYALVLHDHGNGWPGLSYDDDPSGNLTLAELRAALGAVPHLDVLVLDMCLMQMVEVATEVVGEAGYLVASEDLTYGGRLDYAAWLDWLAQHPGATAADLAVEICTQDDNETGSVVDLAHIGALNDAISDFASTALSSATPSDWDHLKDARREADHFEYRSCRDLKQYMDAVSSDAAISASIRATAQAVVAQVNQTILHAKGRGDGLSIYLPVASVARAYNGTTLTFCNRDHADGTRWAEYVQPDTAWWEFWDADWGETVFGAEAIGASSGQPATVESAIDGEADVDFVKFAGVAGQMLNAEVFGSASPGGLWPVLTLYAPDGVTVLAQVAGDADGVARIAGQTLSQNGDYYLAVTAEGNLDPLNPVQGNSSGTYSLTIIWGETADLQPQIALGATSVDFGQVAAGAWAEAMITVDNTGNGVLEITGLALPGGSPFAAPHPSVPLPLRLEPGESANLPVGVRPMALGIVAETLRITSTDPDEPEACISLRVEGIASTPLWTGNVDDHWELVGNWVAELTPGPDTAAALEDPAALHPVLYQDQGVRGLEFRTAGWTIGGAGRELAVGCDGIDSARGGTNTVEPNVALGTDSTWTVGDENTLVLNGALSGGGHTLTKDGEGMLVLGGGQDYGTGLSLTINGGTVRLGGGGTLVLESLTVGSEEALDVADGNLVVDYEAGSTPLVQVTDGVRSGFTDGPAGWWDGPGIQSSAAANDPTYATALGVLDNSHEFLGGLTQFGGVPVDPDSVLVKSTWWGDIDFDGQVTLTDYSVFLYYFFEQENMTPDQMGWWSADLDYDGRVTLTDYNLLLYGFLTQTGPLGAGDVAGGDPAAVLDVAALPSDPGESIQGPEGDVLAMAEGMVSREPTLAAVDDDTPSGETPSSGFALKPLGSETPAGNFTGVLAIAAETLDRAIADGPIVPTADLEAGGPDLDPAIEDGLVDLLSSPALAVLAV